MDGSSQAAGIGQVIVLAGREFTVQGRTVGYQAAIEEEIKRIRGNPIDLMVEAARKLKDEPRLIDTVALALAERFRNWRMASHADYAEFAETPRGMAFNVWYAIRENKNPPDIRQVEFWLGELASEFEMQDVDEIDPETKEKTGNKVSRAVSTGWTKVRDILRSIDFASGDDALGNSIGRQRQPAA